MPAYAGMTQNPATEMPSGLCQGLSPEGKRRAEKRKPMVSASVAGYGGRLSARHCAQGAPGKAQQEHAAFSLRRRTAFSNFGSCAKAEGPVAHSIMRSTRPKAASATQNVSQLLAGTRSGPERSPGAARVPDPRDQTRGRRAPSRLNDRLAMAPFSGRSAAMIGGRGEAGIRFFGGETLLLSRRQSIPRLPLAG